MPPWSFRLSEMFTLKLQQFFFSVQASTLWPWIPRWFLLVSLCSGESWPVCLFGLWGQPFSQCLSLSYGFKRVAIFCLYAFLRVVRIQWQLLSTLQMDLEILSPALIFSKLLYPLQCSDTYVLSSYLEVVFYFLFLIKKHKSFISFTSLLV